MRKRVFLAIIGIVALTTGGSLWGGCWDEGWSVNCVGSSCTYCIELGGGTWSCSQVSGSQAASLCKGARYKD